MLDKESGLSTEYPVSGSQEEDAFITQGKDLEIFLTEEIKISTAVRFLWSVNVRVKRWSTYVRSLFPAL